jgi:LysR family transcriptional regulator, glycine cleavage system transcriptional activator
MHSDLPPLTWLRAFEAAARHLSFTQAAEELHVTQAAISKHVKSLELYLRHPLFHRRPRALELTKSGAAYLPKVQEALHRLALGTREVFGQRRNTALTLRCAMAFSVNWLAPRLPDYLARHPGKSLRIISSVWSDAFDKDAFDLDVQYGTGHWPGHESHRLTWETLTPLCSPDLVASLPLNSPDDLRHHRLLHVLGYQDGWGDWLQAAGASQVDSGSGLQCDSSLIAQELAAHGAGVALGRRSLARQERASGRLIAPFALELPIDEAFHVLAPSTGAPHPDAADFLQWLRAAAQTPA